jgi:hypothetical protein
LFHGGDGVPVDLSVVGGEVRQEERRRRVEEPLTGFPVRLHGSAIHSNEVRACGGRPASTPTSMPTPAILNPGR